MSLVPSIEDFTEDPYGFYREMNGLSRLTAIGENAYLVTDPATIMSILEDHDNFTSVHNLEGHVPICPEATELLAGTLFYHGALFNESPPEHTMFRKTFIKWFTPAAVERMQDTIAAQTRSLLAGIETQDSFDVMGGLALPLPIAIISDLIGIPTEDRPTVKQWNDMWLALQVAPLPADAQIGAARSLSEYDDYMRSLIKAIVSDRVPSLILDMVESIGKPESIHDVDDVIVAIRVMIAAGHETTSGLIGNAVNRLLASDRWEELAGGTDEAVADFIEETLAHDPSVQSAPRTVEVESTVDNTVLPAGTKLHLAIGAFAALQELAPSTDGKQSNKHIAFGHGIHRCVGSHLARVESRIALRGLLDAIPAKPRLDPDNDVVRMPGGFVFRSFVSLPITW